MNIQYIFLLKANWTHIIKNTYKCELMFSNGQFSLEISMFSNCSFINLHIEFHWQELNYRKFTVSNILPKYFGNWLPICELFEYMKKMDVFSIIFNIGKKYVVQYTKFNIPENFFIFNFAFLGKLLDFMCVSFIRSRSSGKLLVDCDEISGWISQKMRWNLRGKIRGHP